MTRSDIIMEVRRVLWNDRERRLRAGWRLLVGLFLFAFVLVVAGGVQAVLSSVSPGSVLLASALALLAWLAFYGIGSGTLVGLSWWLDGRTLPGLGLGGDGWWRNLGFGLVLGVAMTTAVFLVELALGFVTVESVMVAREGVPFDVSLGAGPSLALTVVFFVAVGVFEELFTRGYLLNNIAEGLDGLWSIGPHEAIGTAAVVTSLLFGILHAANAGASALALLNISAVGIFFAATYVVTDDLGIPIGVHITWNFSISSLYGFPVSGLTSPATVLSVRQTGPALITGGRFGPEGGLILYLALAVGIALTVWWVRREGGEVRFRTDIAEPDLRKGKKPK